MIEIRNEMIEYFKVLSDPNRLEIIELLLKGDSCGCTLIEKLTITQPTLSYHLKQITNANLATTKREGNWIKHFIDKDKINDIIAFLEKLRDTKVEQCNL